MRLLAITAVSTAFLSGCSTGPYQSTSTMVPIGPAAVADFSPLVGASVGAAHCEALPESPGGPDTRAVSLVYDEPTARRVTVVVDATGTPVRYTDVRGALSEADDRVGDRTTIGLYLAEGDAYASNRPASGHPVVYEVPLSEALSAESLGRPAATLERVLSTCGVD